MNYQVNDKIHGFTFQQVREIKEMKATLYELRHDVTGASLLYMKTADSNKLFSVAFKTIPDNDTGVFHILEHSVLSGSEKYPVREPFVELLKSSMNTFLNALTFPDKTMYPVSTRNEKDFHNLMGVYLDAVLAPRVLTDPNIFYQEGWHYDMTEEDEVPVYKGVVFNEMKGAESSVETLIRNELMKMMYGETCYGYISGGAVEKIPTLTYEMFCEMYRKYYHPTNAIFYLEGNMDFESSIADLEAYLERFDGPGPVFTIPLAKPKASASVIRYYDLGEEEAAENRAHIAYGRLQGSFADKNDLMAADAVLDYLAGSNDAPLKKAILESGLAENISVGVSSGIKQPFFKIGVTNCRYEDREAIHRVIFDTVSSIVKEGLDRHKLAAELNAMEFQCREESEPRALYHNMSMLSSALYGGDPLLYLDDTAAFAFLREQLTTDYYERLVEQLFDLEDMQIVYMLPSDTIGEEKRKAEEEQLAAAAASWSAQEREEVLELNRNLLLWQQTPDTEEALATIPKLSLTDVERDPVPHHMDESDYRGVKILRHADGTNGIAYIDLYFKVPYRDRETLLALSLMPGLYTNLSTANYSPIELQTQCLEYLGDWDSGLEITVEDKDQEDCELYFTIGISALDAQVPQALRLTKEVLKMTRMDETELIRQRLVQKVEGMRRSITTSGHSFALGYTQAAETTEGAMSEILHGFVQLEYIKELLEHFEERKEALTTQLEKIQREIFNNRNLLISVTTNREAGEVMDLDAWIDAFEVAEENLPQPSGERDLRMKDIPAKIAFSIPSGVSYAVSRANLNRLGAAFGGKWSVLISILRFGYLWDEIRVQGGAYGTGMSVNPVDTMAFHSYRDPSPIRSLDIYDHAADFLEEYCRENEDVESAIISSVSSMEPLLAPSEVGATYTSSYLCGHTTELKRAFRHEMLDTTIEDLKACIPVLRAFAGECRRCVVGHADVIRELEKQGYTIINY